MLKKSFQLGYFREPIKNITHHIIGFAFVDDTDLVTLDMTEPSTVEWEIFENLQASIDRWQGGLWVSGGAIVPEKSFVYPIVFHFNDKGEWRCKSIEEVDFEFSVIDHNGVRQPLPQKEATHSLCTLGVHLAPDGNNSEMVETLRKKVEKWKANIQAGFLNRHEAWPAMNSIILKSLLYPPTSLNSY